MSYTSEEYSALIVHFPSNRNADFASRWLAQIAEADRILTTHRQENPEFEETIESLGVAGLVEFSWPALELVRRWLHDGRAFPLSSRDYELFEAFSDLAEMGFFASDGAHYHVALPAALTREVVLSALLRLAATEGDGCLHPERLLTTTTEANAHREVALMEQRDRLETNDILRDGDIKH